MLDELRRGRYQVNKLKVEILCLKDKDISLVVNRSIFFVYSREILLVERNDGTECCP